MLQTLQHSIFVEMPDESWGSFKSHILHRLLRLSSFSPSQDPMGSCLPQFPDSSLFCKWPGNKRINFGWGIVWQVFQQMWRLLKQIQPFLGTVQFVCTSRVRLNAKLAFVHFFCEKYVFFSNGVHKTDEIVFLNSLLFSRLKSQMKAFLRRCTRKTIFTPSLLINILNIDGMISSWESSRMDAANLQS